VCSFTADYVPILLVLLCYCADAHNVSSTCWIDCFFDTLVGNPKKNVTAMTKDEIINPFVKAFASNDPASGERFSLYHLHGRLNLQEDSYISA